jgi:hypothetical protein
MGGLSLDRLGVNASGEAIGDIGPAQVMEPEIRDRIGDAPLQAFPRRSKVPEEVSIRNPLPATPQDGFDEGREREQMGRPALHVLRLEAHHSRFTREVKLLLGEAEQIPLAQSRKEGHCQRISEVLIGLGGLNEPLPFMGQQDPIAAP